MTEEQFWHSNPRIVHVWENAYRLKVNTLNSYIHSWIGNYGISALICSIDRGLNGKKARSKYIDKPIQIFELTEEEKEEAIKKERNKFIMWAKSNMQKFKKGE